MTLPSRSSSPSLNVDCAGKVWTLTLNRPDKRNALSADLVEAFDRGRAGRGTGPGRFTDSAR